MDARARTPVFCFFPSCQNSLAMASAPPVKRPRLLPPPRVTFAESCKTHDGSRPLAVAFEEFVVGYLQISDKSHTPAPVVAYVRDKCPKDFLDDFVLRISSLLMSMRHTEGEKIPLLPEGGGKQVKLDQSQEGKLLMLLRIIVTVAREACPVVVSGMG